MKKGRATEMIDLRNRLLIARYYYWTDIWERRFEKVLTVLSKEEFFLTEPTLVRLIMRNDHIYREYLDAGTTVNQLARQFPSWNWGQNNKFK